MIFFFDVTADKGGGAAVVLLSSISQCNNGHDVITYNKISVVYIDGKNVPHGRKNSELEIRIRSLVAQNSV